MGVKNLNFQLIAWSVGLQIAYFFAFTTVLADMIYPFNFIDAKEVSYLGSFFELMGICGGFLSSYLIFKYAYRYPGIYKLLSNIINVGTFFSFLLVVYCISARLHGLLYLAVLINGFLNLSCFSVGYEFGVMAALPIEEGMSLGLINMVC
jgi:hypothetical protein